MKTRTNFYAGSKIIALIIFILAVSFTVEAQRITIINGTDSSKYVPINYNLSYGVSEMIYLQPQIGVAGSITKIGLYQVGGGGGYPSIDSIRIFLKHTSNTGFTAGGLDTSGYKLVFSGDVPNGFSNYAAGWVEINLDTPFSYNNIDNLQVMFLRWHGMWNGGVVGNLPFYRLGTNLNRNATRWFSTFGGFDPTSVLNPAAILPNLLLQLRTISGTKKASSSDGLYLYPNPVQDFLYLPLGATLSHLNISDLSGKVLLHQTKPGQRLDLSTFSAGIYIISLYQQEKVQHVKVVKQ